MTTTEPRLEPDAGPNDAGPEPQHTVWRSEQRVLTGTAAGLAEGWGVDPAWVRMAFTVLVLFGGLGLFAYVVAYALLPAGPQAPSPATKEHIVAAVAAVAGLATLGDRWTGSPWAVMVVLAGAAAALWRGPTRRPAVPRSSPTAWASPPAPPSEAAPRVPRPRRVRTRRPPSLMGRLGLAAAVAVVVVVGFASGGRADALAVALAVAAGLCVVGLVAAPSGRRARWLVVPAVLALGASGIAASLDGLGVRLGPTGGWVGYGGDALPARIDRHGGTVQLDLTATTVDAATVVRLGTGDLAIVLDPARPVRVALRSRVGLGSIDVIGQRSSWGYRPSVRTVVGAAEGSPTVTIDAAVGVGSIEVSYLYPPSPPESLGPFPTVAPVPGIAALEPDGTEVYPTGVRRRPDGSLEFPDGTVLRADGSRRYGPGAEVLADGSVRLSDGSVVQADGSVIVPTGGEGGIVLHPGEPPILPGADVDLPQG